jgi:hypothetical protein
LKQPREIQVDAGTTKAGLVRHAFQRLGEQIDCRLRAPAIEYDVGEDSERHSITDASALEEATLQPLERVDQFTRRLLCVVERVLRHECSGGVKQLLGPLRCHDAAPHAGGSRAATATASSTGID